MSYQSEDLVREVQVRRTKAAMSQRALATRSGVTQAHISQMETGRLEPGLKSFIQIARALDLELVLVPKKLLPALEGVLRQSVDDFSLESGTAALFAKGDRFIAKEKKRNGSSATLDRLADYFHFLKRTRLSKADLALVTDVIETLKHSREGHESRTQLDHLAGVLQGLRNRLAHPIETPRPAYAFEQENDDA